MITKKEILENINLDLSEQAVVKRLFQNFDDIIRNAAKNGINISQALKAAAKTVEEKQFIEAVDAVIAHTRKHSKGGRVSLQKESDDFYKSLIKKGPQMGVDQWRQLYTGFLKANNIPSGLLDDVVADLLQNPKFITRYRYKSRKALINTLKTKNYSDDAVNSIIRQIEENPQIGKNYFQTRPKPQSKQPTPDTPPGTKPPGTKPPTTKPPKTPKNPKKKELTPWYKMPLTKNPYRKAQARTVGTWFKRRWIDTKNIFRVLFVAGVGITAYTLKHFYEQHLAEGGNDFLADLSPEEKERYLAMIAEKTNQILKRFPCITSIVDDEGVYLDITEDGNVRIITPNTGNEQYDKEGGLAFYVNGIVQNVTNPRMRGTYACKGQHLSEDYFKNVVDGVLSEQTAKLTGVDPSQYGGDGNKSTGIGDINIRWVTDRNGKSLIKRTTKSCNRKPLPHVKGCLSSKIVNVQGAIGMMANGILDDETINKLTSMGYDMSGGLTQEIYDAIVTKKQQ
jgi:hypothetical protein